MHKGFKHDTIVAVYFPYRNVPGIWPEHIPRLAVFLPGVLVIDVFDALIQKGRQIPLQRIAQHHELWSSIILPPFVPGVGFILTIWMVGVGIVIHHVHEYAPLLAPHLGQLTLAQWRIV